MNNQSKYTTQIIYIGVFFFIFGFITWANSVLIPYLKLACDLDSEWKAYLVTFAFYISYTVMALPSGYILRNIGMISGMRLGLVVMSVGCFLFMPAANMRSYELFLLGLFILGTGLTLLQTSVNPYITLLGPAESAAQRISIMGICNKIAGALAPIILGSIILSNADALTQELTTMNMAQKSILLDDLAQKVVMPYAVLGISLLSIGFLLKYANLPKIKPETTQIQASNQSNSILKHPGLIFGFLAIFCSVAVEVMAADTAGGFAKFHDIPLSQTKWYPTATLILMTAGYVVGIISIPKLISQEKAFKWVTILGLVLSMGVLFLDGIASVYALIGLGFANALLWPAIWPVALRGLHEKMIGIGSSVLVMGIAGGAIIPLIYGVLVDRGSFNHQTAYWILIPLYGYNLYYWFKYMNYPNNN